MNYTNTLNANSTVQVKAGVEQIRLVQIVFPDDGGATQLRDGAEPYNDSTGEWLRGSTPNAVLS